MTVDCYDFYLWSIGELSFPENVERELKTYFNKWSEEL
jgi:hypothetical protein